MPKHSELMKNNRFYVYLGNTRLSFSEISGLGSGMDKEVYAEGGSLYYPHVMQVPGNQLRTLTLRRGIQADSPVIRKLRPGVYIPRIQVIVLNDDNKPYYEYFLEDAWVTKWEVDSLNALDDKVMVDTFEVEYMRSERTYVRG